jgi:hypothetical protein
MVGGVSHLCGLSAPRLLGSWERNFTERPPKTFAVNRAFPEAGPRACLPPLVPASKPAAVRRHRDHVGLMPSPKRREATQSHGESSRVYVPILREIVRRNYKPGVQRIEFTKQDVESVAAELGVRLGNAADVVYRMRSRTRLPDDILDLGFTVLRGIGRGRYALEVGGEALVSLPEHEIYEHNDQTPLPVRRLLPEDLAELDEQGLLTVVGYCSLLDHFTGLTVYRLRSHVRRSVPNIGQAELDEIDVGVALSEEEVPIVFPIEAKASDEVINRVQIATAVAYCETYFPAHTVRPIVVKLTYDGILHFLEFRATTSLPGLRIVHSHGYRLRLSDRQRELIRATRATLDRSAVKPAPLEPSDELASIEIEGEAE